MSASKNKPLTTTGSRNSPVSTTSSTLGASTSATQSQTTAAASLGSNFSDGTWVVGKQISPESYQTYGGSGCYWERSSDLSGSLSSVLANGTPPGHGVVTILASDVGFQTQGCGTWSPLAATGAPLTTFGDGDWAVGINIAPGTYQTSGGSGCYLDLPSDHRLSDYCLSLEMATLELDELHD
ncbi:MULTISPECIES: hypothetical protein [Acidithrix]|uniref:Uncharacterized protein n=1 Tax=Acidithrix ferrooxidans TaxID=1280514 RepID=A0A0D8HLX3_9ACTN|nr:MULTISPECIES: hypothetical protein [Acidithrix]KJF18829.1 hypothetical protein AXFE_02340 [Acidithrix ferrooxidans]